MIYSHKPQRSGKSITTNTNTPPQDPPAPPIPDVLIEDSIPPVLKVCPNESPIPKVVKKVTAPKKTTVKIPKKKIVTTTKIVKLTIKQKISRFLKKIFRRV